MRMPKALGCYMLSLMLCLLLFYYIAEIVPAPFYAAPFLPAAGFLSVCAGAACLGYAREGVLLLRVPLYLGICLPAQLLPLCVWAGEYTAWRYALPYAACCLAGALTAAFCARLICLRNLRKKA